MTSGEARGQQPGTQTLARGLRALELVATTSGGMAISDLADRLGVHRSIASRLLATLAEFNFVVRSNDGRYRVGARLGTLASGVHETMRVIAEPILRALAEDLGATIALLVTEGDEAVALAVVAPSQASYHLNFTVGGRHPIDRAAGGIALLASRPASVGEEVRVTEARDRGYATTFGEVEPGAYGVAVPLPVVDGMPEACLNLITHRAEIAESAPGPMIAAAATLSASLR